MQVSKRDKLCRRVDRLIDRNRKLNQKFFDAEHGSLKEQFIQARMAWNDLKIAAINERIKDLP